MDFKYDQRFQQACAAFDALNAKDPNLIEFEGVQIGKELRDAQAMTRWLHALYPDAGEVAHLAARCQHLCRWEVPRNSYPQGRTAYLQWRSDLKKMHAAKSAEVLRALGYTTPVIDAVVTVNLKQGLKSNADVQQIEDALCLVFLELQFEAYIGQWEADKIVRILKKTWAKMSAVGHRAALQLPLSAAALQLVGRALAK